MEFCILLFKQKRNCSQSPVIATVGGSPDLTPIRLPRSGQSVPFSFSRHRVVRATARDPRLWCTKGEGGCVRRAECVRSPLGQGCARQASFLTRHTHRPRHEKGERTHETRVRRTTLTTCYTDTSGNSESVRAPRTARSTTRDLFPHKSVL